MPWTIIGNVVVALLPRLIGLAENKNVQRGTGVAKKKSVKDAILATIEGVEGISGRDIFNDGEVNRAYDDLNDAIVKFQNALARTKATKAPVDAVPG